MQIARAAAASPAKGLELDYGDDLPMPATPGKKPPPRRARPLAMPEKLGAGPEPVPSPEVTAPALEPPAPARPAPPAEAPETIDLPARLQDLQPAPAKPAVARAAALPAVPAARSVPAAPSIPAALAPPERAPARAKSSSLDELDLPSVPSRDGVAGLPAPRQARPAPAAPKPPAPPKPLAPPAAAAPPQAAPRVELELDLPDVSTSLAPKARRPVVSDLPDVLGAGLPDILGAGLPDVARPGLPDVHSAGLPAVAAGLPAVSAGLPAVSAGLPAVAGGLPAVSAGLPEVVRAGLPDVGAGLPEVAGAALPDVLRAGLPAVSDTGLPEVMGRGVGGFGQINLPVAREAALPEVRAPGIGPADLPSVGDALPAVVGASWDSKSVDENPFGDFGSPGDDPFAGSEADFGSPSEADDPFGGTVEGNGFGASSAEVAEPGAGSAYGEVDIAGGASSASIETEDMEQAIPQRSSQPPGRAAAHANVHAEGTDADTAGSTLELGPERRPVPRRRSKRLIAALAICGCAIAGGALSLEPRLGPFGVHFILDQVHRPEHERQLAQLVTEGRQGAAQDTLDAATAALAHLEAARLLAPRFEPLQARSAFEHYDVGLRFGPLPKLEATAKAALERVDPASTSPGSPLARAARAAAEHDKEAKHYLEALGTDPDARQMLGELALQSEDWAGAVQIWSELAKADPQNARALFGVARAELGRGEPTAARADAQRVLTISPEHVGARILLLEAQRAIADAGVKDAPRDLGTENLVANLVQALPHASPGEAALAQAVLGEVHLAQGRIARAQQAFEEALSIDRAFPRALVGLGEALEIAGRHVEALARFEAAMHARPGLLQAQLGAAKAQIQLGRLPEAQATLQALLDSHPNHPGLLYWRGRAEQAAGDQDAALATYRAAIDAGKGRADSVEAYLALARLQADQGQLAVAQQTLSEAQDKLPPSGALHKALGEIAMSRGEYEAAYAAFQKALSLDSGDTRARFLGATALTRLGRFDEALAAFATVSETDKDFPGLAVERGRLFEESGKNDQALKEYEAALAKSPDDPDVMIRVGCSRVVAGKSADAQEILEKALKVRPRSAEVNYCLGRALFEQDHAVDALPRLERAVDLDPSRAVYQLYVAWVMAEMGRLRDASTSLDKALELDKGLADAYWQRGRLKQKQGAVKDAIRDLQHALELKPSRIEALADLASAFADIGRMPDALETWEEAIARDADNPTWHFRYGKLLSTSGSGGMAAAHLRRAIDLVEEARKAQPSSKPKPPAWLWQAHYLLARELGQVPAAVQHWQAYMRLSPQGDPYRPEALRALTALGQPWDQ
jgi:tetratricopeptide (TPR) repeat protein